MLVCVKSNWRCPVSPLCRLRTKVVARVCFAPNFSQPKLQVRKVAFFVNKTHSPKKQTNVTTGKMPGMVISENLKTMSVYLATAAFAISIFATSFPAYAETLSGQPRTVDGDTFELDGTRLRLYGIDAPEGKQSCQTSQGKDYKCGEVSANQLASKVGKQAVSCEVKNKDQYGRSVAVCSTGGEDLNKWMVANGYAVAYREYSKDYIGDEDLAKKSRKGIWEGTFEEPAKWRREQNSAVKIQPAAPVHAKGCDIKGNINSKGEKIYHVPGGRYYDATIIDAGESWFCNEKEAVTAGWRASKQ